jgi:hypothetical protein
VTGHVWRWGNNSTYRCSPPTGPEKGWIWEWKSGWYGRGAEKGYRCIFIGNNSVPTEAMLVLAMVIQRYRLNLCPVGR